MKKQAVTRIVLCSILLAALLAILGLGLYRNANGWPGWGFSIGSFHIGSYSYKNSDTYTTGGGELDPAGIRNLEIHWVSGSVALEKSEDSRITVSEEREGKTLSQDDQLRYLVSGDTLIIQYCGTRAGFYWMPAHKNLTVALPESMMAQLESVRVESVSSSGSLNGISGMECDLEGVSGAWRLTDCSFDRLDVENVSGATELTACDVKCLDVETVSGSVTADLMDAPGEVKMDSVSGDVRLVLPEGTGFCAVLDSVSGEVETDFPMSKKGDTYLCGDGAAEISMESVSGDLIIQAKAE